MQLPQIINNLYTNRKTDWIIKLDNEVIKPYVIQRWLIMNDEIRAKIRWLDKYVFPLQSNPKMYLSLVWSVINKRNRAPFVKYIKKMNEEDEFSFILERVRKHFNMSDNDYRAVKGRLIKYITKDSDSMAQWFAFYGIPRRYWKKYYLDFNTIKKFGEKEDTAQKNLAGWGL